MTILEDETEETEEETKEKEAEAEAEVSRFTEDPSRQRVYPSGKAGRKEGRRGWGVWRGGRLIEGGDGLVYSAHQGNNER